MLVVPAALTAEFQTVIRAHFDGRAACLVPVAPSSGAKMLNCGPNVTEAIAEGGGSRVVGWRIWWVPQLWIEAQAHVVWRRPDGTWVDVTPNMDDERVAAFVEDASLGGDPGADFVRSRYVRISNHPTVGEFLGNAPALSEYEDLARTGRLSDGQASAARALEERQRELLDEMRALDLV